MALSDLDGVNIWYEARLVEEEKTTVLALLQRFYEPQGGVIRVDEPDAAVFGTVGYQAPEIATMGCGGSCAPNSARRPSSSCSRVTRKPVLSSVSMTTYWSLANS